METSSPAAGDSDKPSSPLPPLDHPDESTLRGVEKADDEVKESEAVAEEIKEEEQGKQLLDEVRRIKAILIIPDQSVDVLFDSLTILQQTKITFDVLQTTMIGKAVTALRKHKDKKIRRFARKLISDWRAVVDEWVAVNPSVEVQAGASSAAAAPTPSAEKEASPAKEATEQAEPVLAQSDPKPDPFDDLLSAQFSKSLTCPNE